MGSRRVGGKGEKRGRGRGGGEETDRRRRARKLKGTSAIKVCYMTNSDHDEYIILTTMMTALRMNGE